MRIIIKNRKINQGVSPIIVSLIIVAIAVASIVAYAFVSGLVAAPQTHTSAESLSLSSPKIVDNTHINVFIKNTGTTELTLSSAFVDGNRVSSEFITNPLPAGENVPVILSDPSALWLGSSHVIKIVASDGTSTETTVQ